MMATALCVAMAGSIVTVPMFRLSSVQAGVVQAINNEEASKIEEDFNYEDISNKLGFTFGSPTLALREIGEGNKALEVSNREQNYFGYAYDLTRFKGSTITLTCKVACYEAGDEEENSLAATIKTAKSGEDDQYNRVASQTTVGKDFVTLTGTYDIPSDVDAAQIYFEGPANVSYLLDDVCILSSGGQGNQNVPTEEAPKIEEDFSNEKYSGTVFGSPTLTVNELGEGNQALYVTDRAQNYFGYAYNLKKFIGNTIKVTGEVAYVNEADCVDDNRFGVTVKLTSDDGDDYRGVTVVTGSAISYTSLTKFEGTYEIPSGLKDASIYFETSPEVSYILDNVSITVVGEYVNPVKPSTPNENDLSTKYKLYELYKDKFNMGVAGEAISHWGNSLSEIGNPDKEKLIKDQFEYFTFGNELKPDYNMGFTSSNNGRVDKLEGQRVETELPYVPNRAAVELLDWCKDNGIKVRGHVLVWHSQCPDEIFCKGFKPVYIDEAKRILDPACFVSKEVMLQRMENYIDSAMKYMYENGYGDVYYAWDVVNEAFDPGAIEWGLRDSNWYKTMGADFIYYAYKYAREAVDKYSVQYAAEYGVDPADEAALDTIRPHLFYNDYNEWMDQHRDDIINYFKNYKPEGCDKSAIEAGYIDGMGMQSHLSDNSDLESYANALRMYADAFGEVQATELDVLQTTSGANADYYQAQFYKQLFEEYLKAVDEGYNLTAVTIWGLTDDNSWRKENKPLIFNGDLSSKLAYNAIVYALTGEELPGPAYVAPDFTDICLRFDEEEVDLGGLGVTPRGDALVKIQKDVVHNGKASILATGRTSSWHGAYLDVSRFAGQTIEISAWVKSEDDIVKLSADLGNAWPNIAEVNTKDGEWKQIRGTYKIPYGMNSLKVYFESNGIADIYLDDVQVKLVGLDEGFEEGGNGIASPRGVGHMPLFIIDDTDSHNESGHALRVKRDAQEATARFDIGKYIGEMVTVKAYVKTDDSKITLGFDDATAIPLATVDSVPGEWTEVSATFEISDLLASANMYIETDGTSDFLVDDFSVRIAEKVHDFETVESADARWNGAGALKYVTENDNKVAVLTDREANYYGIVFDVSNYVGTDVEFSFDVKTDDNVVKLSGDLGDAWPNYISTTVTPGEWNTVKGFATLPSGLQTLKVYIETDGTSDLYVDNFKIRRTALGTEHKVSFVCSDATLVPETMFAVEGNLLPAISKDKDGEVVIENFYKDAAFTTPWNFNVDRVTEDTVIYVRTVNEQPGSSEEPTQGGHISIGGEVVPTEAPTETPEVETPVVNETETSVTTTISSANAKTISADKASLKALLKAGKDVSYEFTNAEGKAEYSWTFKAANYDNKTSFTKVDLAVQKESASELGFINGIKLDLAEDAKLPMQATLKVDVSKNFKPGDKAYLYIYNKETGKLDCVPNSKYVVDKDGYVSLNIITGGEYVVLPKAASKAEKTSVINQISVDKIKIAQKGKKATVVVNLPDTVEKVTSLKKFDGNVDNAVYGATVTYSTSDKKVATINKDGKLTIKGKGKVTITVTVKLSNGTSKSYTQTITVK